MLLSPLPPFTIGHGDNATVDIVNKCEKSYHTMRHGRNVSRTGVRLENPLELEFQMDCCLECRGMLKYV